MNTRQFKFNIVVSLSICAMGAVLAQVDAAGVSLLSVGLMLTLLSLVTMPKTKRVQHSVKSRLRADFAAYYNTQPSR